MEHQLLRQGDHDYPKRLLERLGEEAPPEVYYQGPLSHLKRFTLAVISADSISGEAMIAANELLFTLREYEMNYVGGWHSVMETEIFRLGLFRKNVSMTLFSAKGLEKETFESFLQDRFCPPLHQFPEREEYLRRAEDGELLMLSVAEPQVSRTIRRNVLARNLTACVLADLVFVPFATKGTKTYRMAKRIIQANVPTFATDDKSNSDLHELGVPAFNRTTVGKYLEGIGAVKAKTEKTDGPRVVLPDSRVSDAEPRKPPGQLSIWSSKGKKRR